MPRQARSFQEKKTAARARIEEFLAVAFKHEFCASVRMLRRAAHNGGFDEFVVPVLADLEAETRIVIMGGYKTGMIYPFKGGEDAADNAGV